MATELELRQSFENITVFTGKLFSAIKIPILQYSEFRNGGNFIESHEFAFTILFIHGGINIHQKIFFLAGQGSCKKIVNAFFLLFIFIYMCKVDFQINAQIPEFLKIRTVIS